MISKRVGAGLLASFLATAACAESLASRYGVVTATASGKEGSFELSFQGKQLAVIEAAGVSLLRVAPEGRLEHIVVESARPGLHCRKAYMILSIRPDQRTRLSPPLGECMVLQGVSHIRQGIKLNFRPPHIDGVQPGAPVSYTWREGKLSKSQG